MHWASNYIGRSLLIRQRQERSTERGAILLHVAGALVTLMAFSALSVDYGVLWVSRGQVQNAADAGALSGAVSLAFVDLTDQTLARSSALAVGQQNAVWDAAPDVTGSDITFPTCPSNAPGGANGCIKVDVFRNQRAGGNPLPTFFGQLLGVTHGVRGTATAQVLIGDSSDCVKPWGVPDKWIELNPSAGPWTTNSDFERYVQNGPNKGALLSPADSYTPPSVSSPGTGFRLPDDYGTAVTLKHGNPNQAISPGQFFPMAINPGETGAANYEDNIANCDPTVIGPGSVIQSEPGNMIGPTSSGVQTLIAGDPSGWWDSSANGGLGRPAGGCMAAGTCIKSPRLVAIPLFDPDVFDSGRTSGRIDITITNIMGFWIEGMQGNDVQGYMTYYPALASGTTTIGPQSAFLRTVVLVR